MTDDRRERWLRLQPDLSDGAAQFIGSEKPRQAEADVRVATSSSERRSQRRSGDLFH